MEWNDRKEFVGSDDLTCYYGSHKRQRGMKSNCSVVQLKHFISKFPSITPHFTLLEYYQMVAEMLDENCQFQWIKFLHTFV